MIQTWNTFREYPCLEGVTHLDHEGGTVGQSRLLFLDPESLTGEVALRKLSTAKSYRRHNVRSTPRLWCDFTRFDIELSEGERDA
jgi:hypothetical protein